MSSEDKSTTTVTPSAFDESKSKTINQLRELLFPAMTPQLSGAMTSKSQEGMDLAGMKGVAQSAAGGVQRGEESMLSNLVTGMGDKSSALNMALQLYGYQPMTQASTASKSSGPNAGAKAGAGINAAKSAYNLGKDAYDSWGTGSTNGFSDFSYQPLETPSMSPGTMSMNNPYMLPDYGMGSTAEAMGGAYALPSYSFGGAGSAAAASEAASMSAALAAEGAGESASIYEILAALFI